MPKINERIKKIRKSKNFTVAEVAEYLGVTESTALRYEAKNGIKAIPYEVIEKYAKLFGCAPQHIMGWDQDEIDAASEMQRDAAEHPLPKVQKKKRNNSGETTYFSEFVKVLSNLTDEQLHLLLIVAKEFTKANGKEGE